MQGAYPSRGLFVHLNFLFATYLFHLNLSRLVLRFLRGPDAQGNQQDKYTLFLFDSEESFGPDGISLHGALEAGGP